MRFNISGIFPAIRHFITDQINNCMRYKQQLLSSYLSFDQFKYILETRKVDPNYAVDGFTPLHKVAITPDKNQSRRIDILLNLGANINVQCNAEHHNTPLQLLIANENTSIAIHLIEKAKQLNKTVDLNIRDVNQCTPLLLAAKMRLTSLAIYLLQQSPGGCINVNAQDCDGMTALHYAAALGQTEMAQMLIAMGAHKEVTNGAKETPWDAAHYSAEKINKILLAVEIDPERDSNARLNNVTDENLQRLLAMLPIAPMPVPISLPAKKIPRDAVDELLRMDFTDSGIMLNERRIAAMKPSSKVHIKKQFDSFTGESLLSACLNGQSQLRNLLRAELANPPTEITTNSLARRKKSAENIVQYGINQTQWASNKPLSGNQAEQTAELRQACVSICK